MIDCLINGRKGKKFSENVRMFSLRHQYYSTASFISLRNFFNNNLPSVRALQLWYSTVDGSPGISKSALDILREKSQEYYAQHKHPLHVTLIYDEMSIRKQIVWSRHHESFIGYSTVTNSSNKNPDSITGLPTAKYSLVLMVAGPDFKLAVAYHFLNGLEAFDRASLTLDVIKSIENVGAIVMSLTGDGLKLNVTVPEILGAKYKENKPFFYSPTHFDQKIYVIFDPPHMLKLIRSHFAEGPLYHNDRLIDWNLLCTLVEKQAPGNFNLCNKLTQNHIQWHLKPMNVKLAAQTLSKSVGDVLEQLRIDGFVEFKDARETSEFLWINNDIFDLFNFAEKNTPDGRYKRPLCEETAQDFFSFFEQFRQYTRELSIDVTSKKGKVTRKKILESRVNMGFFGFYVNTISLEGIYNDFVANGPLKKIYTMQFSQDHLETYFSLIRNRQGRNDNPNALEFASAFRKLLVCHPLLTCLDKNSITNATGILTVSSRQPTVKTNVSLEQVESVELEVNFNDTITSEKESMDEYDLHVCAYVALSIEQKLSNVNLKILKCSECIRILFDQNEKYTDDLLQRNTDQTVKIKQPCESTMTIVIFSNAVMKAISCHKEISFHTVLKTIYINLDIDQLYTGSEFEEHTYKIPNGNNHKEFFIMEVIRMYLTLKSKNIGARINDEERLAFVRSAHKARKHFAGK